MNSPPWTSSQDSPEFGRSASSCQGPLCGLVLCPRPLDLCGGTCSSFLFHFLFNLDPKGNENFLFPRNLQKGLCASGVRTEGMSAGVGPDLLCSAQVAELTTRREVPATRSILGSGLWPRESREFSLSQLGAGAFKAPGPHPQPPSTLWQPTPFILQNPAIFPRQAIGTVAPC